MDSCKTIGILGGGQLASLIGTELLKKNLKFCIYAQDINEPACEIAHYVVLGEKNDLQKLRRCANSFVTKRFAPGYQDYAHFGAFSPYLM